MATGIYTSIKNKQSGEMEFKEKNPFLCEPEFKNTNLKPEVQAILAKMFSPNPPSF